MNLGQVFAYIDGNPSKGCWIVMNSLVTPDYVRRTLENCGFSGEVKFGDGECLASAFITDEGDFDFEKFHAFAAVEWVDETAVMVYVESQGLEEADVEDFLERYLGRGDKPEIAEKWCRRKYGEIVRQAEEVGLIFNWEGTAQGLFISDLEVIDGHGFSAA